MKQKDPSISPSDKAQQLVDANLRSLFEQAPVIMHVMRGPEHRFEFFHPLGKALSGGRDFTGMKVAEALPEYEEQGFVKLLDDIYQSGENISLPETYAQTRQPDGSFVEGYYDVILRPFRDETGAITGILNISVDVTDKVLARKKAEESEAALRHLKDQLDLSISAGRIGTWHWDVKADVLFWSKEQEALYGLEEGSFGGRSADFTRFIHPEDYVRMQAKNDERIQSPNPDYQEEFRITRPDGAVRWIQARQRKLLDGEGNLTAITGINIDITDQKEAGERVLESEARFRLMADAIPEIVWVTDANGNGEFMNKRWEDYSGAAYVPNNAEMAQTFMHPEDIPKIMGSFGKALQTGMPFEVEQRNLSASGHYRWFLNRGVPYRSPQTGEIEKWFGISTDIHERKTMESALRESRNQLEFAIEATELGTWDFNPATGTFKSNARLKEWFGLEEAEEISLTHVLAIIDEADQPRVTEAIDKALQYESGGVYDMTYTIRNPQTGAVRNVRAKGRVYFNEEKVAVRFNGTIQDLTAELVAQRQITESEQRFRQFSNNIANLAWIADGEGWIYWYNQRWFEFTGTTLEEMQGWGWSKVHHPDHTDRVVSFVKEAWHKPEPFELTFPLLGADGNYQWFLTRGAPILDKDGKVIRWIGTNTNIHEQVLAQEALKESEARFRTLADKLPLLIWMNSPEGVSEFTSASWEEFSGIADITEAWQWMAHPDDWERIMENWAMHFAAGLPFRQEVRIRNKHGQYRWHNSIGEPIKDANGNIIKWIGALTDIHAQKTFAEALERQVAGRTEELAKSNRELERSNEDLQQFAHVASHDLKEPVRKIMVFANMLDSADGKGLSERGRMSLEKIQNAAERMMGMMNGILTYARLSAVDQTMEPIDLEEVIRNVEADLELLMEQKSATITRVQLPQVKGTPVLIYQLFYNLINNALKFSRADVPAHITITSAPAENGMVVLTLSDNGIGFEQQYADNIFKTFTRLNTKDKYEGTGLGLSLCKKTVEWHGGTIRAEGKEGEGATFVFTLPVVG